MRRACLLTVAVALTACRRPSDVSASVQPPPAPPPVVVADGGTPDAGGPDAGSPDAGSPDAGPPPADPHRIGGLGPGPWPLAPMTVYGGAQGLMEGVRSASTDEGQNLWVVTDEALYLLEPGARTFRRYTAQDGLHVGPGYTEPPNFTVVAGGRPGECFVGYWAHDTFDPPGTSPQRAHTEADPMAHMGKMDQVLLRADHTLEVRRYDFHNSNNGWYYETREITSAVYDHFQHPGELYVGSNHGVTRVTPAKWRLPRTPEEQAWPISVEREWYADHVHPWVCMGGPCSDPNRASTFGDWFGLTLAPDGRLWMGGLTSAGAIGFRPDLSEWVQSWDPHNPFIPAFGDPYPGNPPIFNPPREGDPVNIRAVAVTKDGGVWFASGEVEAWRGPTYGLAELPPKRPDGSQPPFLFVDPTSIGAVEYNVLEMVAWPDGRLVLGFPNSGLLVWTPGEPRGARLTAREGLPGERIGRLSVDLMTDPPQLFVPTEGGLAVFRSLP